MTKKQDKCLHLTTIEQIVSNRIEEIDVENWMYVLKQAIRGTIYSYWYEEMQKSEHRSSGKGWVYVGDAFGITRNPKANAVDKQTERVLKMLHEKKVLSLN